MNTNIFLFLTLLLVTLVFIHLKGILLFYTIAQHLPIVTRLKPAFEQLGQILLSLRLKFFNYIMLMYLALHST